MAAPAAALQESRDPTLPMRWDEGVDRDAVALAERVRRGAVRPAEPAAQAAAGVAKVKPLLCAVVEVFDDAVADRLKAGVHAEGPLAGVPVLLKDPGPTLKDGWPVAFGPHPRTRVARV